MTAPTFRQSTRKIVPPSERELKDDSAPPKPPRIEVPQERPGPVAKWVANNYRLLGEAWSKVDPVCGTTLKFSADSAGMAWQRAYKQVDWVKKLIDYLMQSSVAGELFMAHLPIFLAVITHHNPQLRDKLANSTLAPFLSLPDIPVEENEGAA